MQPESITQHVAGHPGAVWAVGPFFAALTGVAFKEGVCYGKPECAALFFMTPALLLGERWAHPLARLASVVHAKVWLSRIAEQPAWWQAAQSLPQTY